MKSIKFRCYFDVNEDEIKSNQPFKQIFRSCDPYFEKCRQYGPASYVHNQDLCHLSDSETHNIQLLLAGNNMENKIGFKL